MPKKFVPIAFKPMKLQLPIVTAVGRLLKAKPGQKQLTKVVKIDDQGKVTTLIERETN